MCKTETRIEECFKCAGKGTIEGFGHVAQGVCFQCKGTGKLTINVTATRGKVPAWIQKKADFILAADENSFAGLSFERLSNARDFAHNYVMNAAARELYGDSVHTKWFEVGEPHFQSAQTDKLQNWYDA